MRRPEQALAIAAAQYLRLALRPPSLWFCLDHGAGKMSPAAAGLLQRRGGVRGLPDLIVISPAIAYPANKTIPLTIAVELKSDRGRQSPAQKRMQAAWEAAGGFYYVARSIDDIEFRLRNLGIPLFASVGPKGSLWPRAAA